MTTTMPAAEVRYEGDEPGASYWGMTQANFTILGGSLTHAREVGVQINNAAAQSVAAALGVDDTVELRRLAARASGEILLPRLLQKGERIEPLVTVSRASFDADPQLLDAVCAGVRAASSNP